METHEEIEAELDKVDRLLTVAMWLAGVSVILQVVAIGIRALYAGRV